jgi:hypothetical protein
MHKGKGTLDPPCRAGPGSCDIPPIAPEGSGGSQGLDFLQTPCGSAREVAEVAEAQDPKKAGLKCACSAANVLSVARINRHKM